MSFFKNLNIKRYAMVASTAALLLAGSVGSADAAGLLSPKDGSTPPLDIRDHAVNVVIEDGYAITQVEQVFANPNASDFEATYSFPIPDKAAVSEFTYWIDGKPVSGEVLPKQKAQDVYDKEKAAGRETAITKQNSYKTFDMSVWPVRAGKDVRVRLSYIQPAHLDTGVGRYLYPLEEGGTDQQAASFWSTNDTVTGNFSFDLEIRSGYPIQTVRLPAHPNAQISRDTEGDWHVHIGHAGNAGQSASPVSDEITAPPSTTSVGPNTLPAPVIAITPSPNAEETVSSAAASIPSGGIQAAPFRLDQDIALYWKLQDGLPGSVDVISHKEAGKKRGTFMLAVTPGDDLKKITEGRDWVFILDISGSMKSKFATLAEGVSEGLRKLTPKDRFRIVYFNDKSSGTNGFKNATKANIDQALNELGAVQPNGGTNLYAGMAHGLQSLDADRSAGIVLVTDGVANVGETHKRAFIKMVDKQDVRLSTLVMGNNANRPLLKAISYASGGTSISVSNSDDVVGAVLSATSKLTHEAMHDVTVNIDGVKTSDVAPARIGTIYRGQQLVLFGHYWGSGKANITLNAKVSGKPVSYKVQHTFPEQQTRNPEIERLWAFAAIEDMMQEMDLFGEQDDIKQAATDLAVETSLVTPFTSMVVVQDKVFANYGIDRLNKARLSKETAAQNQRAKQSVQPQQVAKVTSPFKNNQASYSGSSGGGSGAIDMIDMLLLILASVPIIGMYARRQRAK